MKFTAICTSLLLLSSVVFAQQKQSLLIETWEVNAWENNGQVLYTYHPNGDSANVIGQSWIPATQSWANSGRTTYNYDSNGNMIQALDESWNGNVPGWSNTLRFSYTYTPAGKQQSMLHEYWNNVSWQNQNFYEYTYDVNGQLATWKRSSWNITTNAFTPGYLISYTYNGNGTLQQHLVQTFNSTSSSWVNNFRSSITYTPSGKPAFRIGEQFSNGNWVNSNKLIYTYDASGFLINELIQAWYNQWVDVVQTLYTNTATGLPLQYTRQQWEPTVNAWLNYSRYTITYGAFTASLPHLFPASGLYPNPAYEQITLQFPEEIPASEFSITDLRGRLLLSQRSAGQEVTLTVSQLPAGYYLLKTEGAFGRQVYKFQKY